MKRYVLTIDGMGCAHCVKSVAEAMTDIGASVENCVIGSATVLFDADTQLLIDAVADRGFTVTNVAEA